MIKWILSKLKTEDLEAEWFKRYEEDLDAYTPEAKEVDEIVEALAGIEGIQAYLRSIMLHDRTRYFNAPVESQAYIKGAFSRTLYLLKKVREKDTMKIISKGAEYTNPRHAA